MFTFNPDIPSAKLYPVPGTTAITWPKNQFADAAVRALRATQEFQALAPLQPELSTSSGNNNGKETVGVNDGEA